MKRLGLFGVILLGLFGSVAYADMPATTTYKLNSFGFGSGGIANSSTSTYALEGSTGEISGQPSSTATYSTLPGFIQTQQANVPKILAFDNNSGIYYNKLHFTIENTLPNNPNNPTDAIYALQISTTSNFSSNVYYIKSDFTIGATLTTADYQNYAAFGGASGTTVNGLTPGVTYYLRAKAAQHQFSKPNGYYSESAYGPSASTSTANPSLTFTMTNSTINFGSLLPGSVINAPSNVNITLTTNAVSGATVYVSGKYGGLKSPSTSAIINSASGDLGSLSNGFGAQSTAASQLGAVSPYNVSSNNVGIIDPTIRNIYTAAGPVSAGSGTILLKAKSATTDKAAPDYTETVTMLASASF